MERNGTTAGELDAPRVHAEMAFSAGDWAAAATAYQGLICTSPEEVELKLRLARAYEELGRVDEAVQLLSDSSAAGFGKAKRMLARIYMETRNYAAAMPVVNDLLAETPDDPKLLKWKDHCASKLTASTGAPELMERAQALFSANRLEEAEQLYLEQLAEQPNTARAYFRLGQIYILQRRWADAIPRLRAALRLDQANSKAGKALAYALLKSREPAQAIAVLDSLQSRGDDVEIPMMLQRCHMKLGDWARVDEIGSQLLDVLAADDPRRELVVDLRQDALLEMELAEVNAILESGDIERATAGYRDVAQRHPQSALGWLKLGTALVSAGREAEAVPALREALRCRPEDAKVRSALTSAIIRTSEEQEILRYVQEAIATETEDYECYRWLAQFHNRNHNWQSALRSAQNALAIRPQDSSARMLVARSLMRLSRLPEALDELNILLKKRDRRVVALQLKADILTRLARIDDAIELYQEALEGDPGNALIQHRLSYAFLLKGDIENFHKFYEERRNVKTFIENNKTYPFLDWTGDLSIEGKLLVWGEFGLGVGMNIMHMAFLNPLSALGFDIVLEVEPRLVDLCRRSFPDITAVANDVELPPGISHHTPIGSLSRWFKPDLASFETMRPYLLPDAQAVARHRDRLQRAAGEGQILVGISWASTNPFVGDVKCVPLDQLLNSISFPGVTLVNLQYGDHSESIALAERSTGNRLMDSGIDNSNDLDGLCAVVAAMDLVVCIGHTTAHVAGAVGTPNFVMLPAAPFGHWLDKGERCIWYPASTLFRRAPVDEDWSTLLQQVHHAVVEFTSRHDEDSWLAATLLPGLRPTSALAESMPARELRDAVFAFFNQGAFGSALELMDRLPSDHLSRELEILRGDMLALIGQWEQARSLYLSLRSSSEADGSLDEKVLSTSLAMYDLEFALPIARSLADEAPAYRLVAANILYHLRNHQGALAELRNLSLQAPQSDGLSRLTGTVLLEMAEYERAETYLRHQAAMTRRPEDYTLLGRAISAQGRLEDALGVYDKAVSLSKKHPAANFWRTQAGIELGLVPQVPLSPLLGDVPKVAPDEVVIFFAVDSSYFWEHGLVLLGSLGCRSPRAKCHVHVINPDAGIARAVDIVRATLPDLSLSYSYEHVDFEGCSDLHIRTYYASVRFVRLAEIFGQSPAVYLSVDADSLFRGEVSGQERGKSIADVDLYMRYHNHPQMAVLASALILRPTAAAAKFIDRVSALIKSTLEACEAVWFLDQIVLGHVLRELGDGEVHVGLLDRTYLDWFFHDDSLMWTGKGKRKSDDSKYKSEVSKYQYLRANEAISALMPQSTDGSSD